MHERKKERKKEIVCLIIKVEGEKKVPIMESDEAKNYFTTVINDNRMPWIIKFIYVIIFIIRISIILSS